MGSEETGVPSENTIQETAPGVYSVGRDLSSTRTGPFGGPVCDTSFLTVASAAVAGRKAA